MLWRNYLDNVGDDKKDRVPGLVPIDDAIDIL